MGARVGHFEIPVDDLERAAAFYRTAFGWRVERLEWDGPGYHTVRVPSGAGTGGDGSSGAIGGGLMERQGLGVSQPLLVVHVERDLLEEYLQRVVAAGGEVEQPPRPVGGMGIFARIRDTEGNLLGLWAAGR